MRQARNDETTMAAAFGRAGWNIEDMGAYATARRFIEKGGTLERWIAIYKQAADKMPEGGQAVDASQKRIAPDRQPHAEASGHSEIAAKGHPVVAAASAPTPVREPSAAQRAAAAKVAQTIAVTVLDTYRIRDGRAIGDVRFGELERLRSANAAEASLIRQIQRHATADHDARVRDVVKADELQRMIQKAAEVADAA